MIILGIETSCDETAISIVEAKGDLDDLEFKLHGSAVHSQVDIHKEYGGVFPTLAKREHLKNLPLVLESALKKASLAMDKIDLIAVTVGPGLEPALWTGINFAEDLGKKWGVPIVGTNHMEGHIASVLLGETDASSKSEIRNLKQDLEFRASNLIFPAIALLISGGHTELVYLKNWKEKEKIGETKDDAVGEAFDKVARMLGLPYPGGPEISRLAEEAREKNISLDTKFPRPMINSRDLNFSFSGLKTAVLYYVKKLRNSSLNELYEREESISQFQKLQISREFEDAVVETLVSKTKAAIDRYDPKTLIIGGGVIANKALRENFLKLKEKYRELEILIPQKSLTTDNAVMIAVAGYIAHKSGRNNKLKADGNLTY